MSPALAGKERVRLALLGLALLEAIYASLFSVRRHPAILGLCTALGLSLNCTGSDPAQELAVRRAVQIASTEEGEIATRAAAELGARGKGALQEIETALHTASPAGRRNLVVALRRTGAAEAAPLLGHLAAYDVDDAVRLEARWTLKLWGASGGDRGAAAKEALRRADEVRGSEGTG